MPEWGGAEDGGGEGEDGGGSDGEGKGGAPEPLPVTLLSTYVRDDPTAALPWIQQARSNYDTLWDALATDERRVSFGDTFSSVARMLQRQAP